MIYILDNDEPPIDHTLYFVEVSDREAAMLGDALGPVLLSNFQEYSKGAFVAGIADCIRWRNGHKQRYESLGAWIYLHYIVKLTNDYQTLYRVPTIPPLGDEAIEFLIANHIEARPKDREKFQEFIDWDDVRLALMDGR